MYLKITEWAEEDRPREKLKNQGTSALSDAELLAILISTGTKEKSAVDLGRELLKMADNNLNTLGKLSIKELSTVNGVGDAKAVKISAALELGRRRRLSSPPEEKQIKSSRDAADIIQPVLADLYHEEFWVLLLNRSNKVTEKYKLSQGGVSGTVTDVRLIMKKVAERLASGIILCHNHPSGNLSPSDADIKLTKKIKEAAALMDVQLLDHLIISGNGYYSFADEGNL